MNKNKDGSDEQCLSILHREDETTIVTNSIPRGVLKRDGKFSFLISQLIDINF